MYKRKAPAPHGRHSRPAIFPLARKIRGPMRSILSGDIADPLGNKFSPRIVRQMNFRRMKIIQRAAGVYKFSKSRLSHEIRRACFAGINPIVLAPMPEQTSEQTDGRATLNEIGYNRLGGR